MSARRIKRRRRRVDERGIALILVLTSITLLTVFLTQLQEETSSELAAALSERDALRAEYYARSAVNLGRLLIATEPQIRKDVSFIFLLLNPKGQAPQIPVWEFTDLVLGPFNDAVGSQQFLATIGGDPMTAKNIGLTGGGRWELSIVDEDAKIDLNTAAQNSFAANELLGRQLLGLFLPTADDALFQGRDGDGQFSDRQTICSALVDWVDSDPSGNETQYPCQPNNTSNVSTGPEDNFYQMVGLPYLRKNAAFDSLDEARLVRGMSDDIWATFVDPEPENPKKRVMTVWGQGEVNINAASAQTLLAIACGAAPDAELCNDPLQMQAFIMIVTMGKSMTMGMPLFGSPKDFIDLMGGKGTLGPLLTQPPFNIKPITFKDPKSLQKSLRTNSKRFSIYADGIVPGYKRTTKVRIHAVVDFRDAGAIGALGSVVVGGGNAAAQAAAAPASTSVQGTTSAVPGASGTSGGSGLNALTSGTNSQPLTTDQILGAMNSNPAGTIIYWRVE
jgi:general secretion pathway protein K